MTCFNTLCHTCALIRVKQLNPCNRNLVTLSLVGPIRALNFTKMVCDLWSSDPSVGSTSSLKWICFARTALHESWKNPYLSCMGAARHSRTTINSSYPLATHAFKSAVFWLIAPNKHKVWTAGRWSCWAQQLELRFWDERTILGYPLSLTSYRSKFKKKINLKKQLRCQSDAWAVAYLPYYLELYHLSSYINFLNKAKHFNSELKSIVSQWFDQTSAWIKLESRSVM